MPPHRQALAEPTTIVTRPSMLAWSRFGWCLVAAVLGVTLVPRLGAGAPWLPAPLVVSAAVASGGLSAAAWALAGALLLDVLAPGSGALGASAVPALAAALLVGRCVRWWAASSWAPLLLGVVACLGVQAVGIALRAAASGELAFDVIHTLASSLTTAVLTATLAPAWVRWARRQQQRGRA